MNSHIHSSSIELWRIIKEGYKPHEPNNITQQEVVDDQLNATALHMIHASVNPKDCTRAHSFKTTKEAWDHLLYLFLGNGNIQSSKFDEVNTADDCFVMNEGEIAYDMYR
jgi:hypothetical protein